MNVNVKNRQLMCKRSDEYDCVLLRLEIDPSYTDEMDEKMNHSCVASWSCCERLNSEFSLFL